MQFLHMTINVIWVSPVWEAVKWRVKAGNSVPQYKWTAEKTSGEVLRLNEVTTSTGDGSPLLVLRPDVLTAGSEYTLTLNVSHSSSGLWGSASAALQLNLPPRGGSCSLSPDDSVQLLQDVVTFSCSGQSWAARLSQKRFFRFISDICLDKFGLLWLVMYLAVQ